MLSLALIVVAQADGPRTTQVGLVEPTTLAVEVRAGRVEIPPAYPNPDWKPGYVPPKAREVFAPGTQRLIGTIIGFDGKLIQPVERRVGGRFDASAVTTTSPIRLTLEGRPVQATLIGRKSLPGDAARTGGWEFDATTIDRFYLRLTQPMPTGRLQVTVPGAPPRTLQWDSRRVRTEALRVNQSGFRTDDPDKSGLFSIWMGSAGASTWVPTAFEVLDAKTLRPVLKGQARLHHDGKVPDTTNGDLGSVAPVYTLDFSALAAPGTYRLHVPGVGCSYDFEVGPRAWQDVFATSLKGFYYQRNSIAHGPPFSTYRAPRAFHPDDGFVVYHSTCSLMDSGNGLNALGTDKDNFGNLVKGATTEVVPNVWGGYKDAGDWDTRIQHLEASRMLLELVDAFPDRLERVRVNLPETGKGLPDAVAEAKWNLDLYRRLQNAEGGVRGGYEFEEHPKMGETSWTNSYKAYAYAPDPWSSWLYAATAARFAHVVRRWNPGMAADYLATAERAYAWAVKEKTRLNRDKYPADVRDAQNLAAAELMRATGSDRWEADFLATCQFLAPGSPLEEWGKVNQGEAAAVVVQSGRPSSAVASARAALVRQADQVLGRVAKTSFRMGHVNEHAYPGYSRDVSPSGAKFLIWAHRATQDAKYLKGLLQAAGFMMGANPTNTVMISGVGDNPVQAPFMIDPRMLGGKFPAGITVYGPMFYAKESEGPWFRLAKPWMVPSGEAWPVTESWFPSYWTIMMNEFTINQSMGPTSFITGYLAFR